MPTPHESPTQALYRAALGPVQSEHHLRVFERFDSLGAAVPSWNWAAALVTLNWLIYRRLWRIAALYAVLVGAVAAALWGLAWGRLPDGVTLGLAGALALAAIAVPGLYGNAWLHGQLRMALVEAARQAPSMADAAEVLRQRAPSLPRLLVLCLVNLLLLAAVVVWSWRSDRAAPAATPLAAATTAAPTTSAEAASAAQTAPSGTVIETVTSPLLPQATAATKPAEAARPQVAAPTIETPPQSAATPPVSAAPMPAPPPPAPQPSASPEPAPEPVARSLSEPIAVAVPGASGRAVPDTFARGAYGVNVGLFAQRDNAQRALARIRQAGLPARSDTLQMERGPRVRVRAGPFANRAQADQAAARIKALGLDAQVFRQGASE